MGVVKSPGPVLTFSLLCAFNFLLSFTLATLNNNNENNSLKRSPNLEEFQYCLKNSQHPRLRECVGRVALSFLQRFDENQNYHIAEDLVTSKDDTISGRSLINLLDTDPVDFRGILENAGAVFSQRSVEWHMNGIYPGLMLKIGPTADANSVAEFIIDPTLNERQFIDQEPSTARILTKQYLLPFLLGLKFNLVALVPLLFAGICLLLKKSLFLVKLAIYVSSFLGVGGAAGLLGGIGGIGTNLGGYHDLFGTGLGVRPIRANSVGYDVASATSQGGYFPGKTSVFNQHFESANEDLNHATPYKRNERKFNFKKQREYVKTETVAPTAPAVADHFYDYENYMMIHDRVGKLPASNRKLGPSAFDADEGNPKTIFQTGEQSEWKVVDIGK